MTPMNLYTKQKQTHKHNKLTFIKWERGGGGKNQEFEININMLLHTK